ncbi:MAG: guanylate kinase [Lachnospiraceae bacterium]|nr:guanylate kinase [Lachnospiraceae bacterium]
MPALEKKGILVVISGFSGAGKGTIVKALLSQHSDYALSVSATTRGMREGERDGIDYFFVTKEHFTDMIEGGELYEYAEYSNNYYGTPKSYVDRQMEEGKDIILEIDVRGAMNIKKRFPDTVLIFVTPPGASDLRYRLEHRGSETAEKIAWRLKRAEEEVKYLPEYDYVLVNEDVGESTEFLHSIIRSEHAKVVRNSEFVEDITRELLELNKSTDGQ